MAGSAKVVIFSEFTDSVQHIMNNLEYAGEKLEAQEIYFNDGSTQNVDPENILDFTENYKKEEIKFIEVKTKDGIVTRLTPEKYLNRVEQKQEVVNETIIVSNPGTDKETVRDFSIGDFIEYMGNRPGVEKDEKDATGLFGKTGNVTTKSAHQVASALEGNTWWSHSISLHGFDAEEKGFDNREAWKNLMTAKAMKIAEMYQVPYKNFVFYGAFHKKDNHPHIHLFHTSVEKSESTRVSRNVTAMKKSSRAFRSMVFNEIFKDDISYLKQEKNLLQSQLKEKIDELSLNINGKRYPVHEALLSKVKEIIPELQSHSGRASYMYLNSATKEKIDDFLRLSVKHDSNIKSLYLDFMNTQRTFIESYNKDPEKIEQELKKQETKFFAPRKKDNTSIHNAILKNLYVLESETTAKNSIPAVHSNNKPKQSRDYKQKEAEKVEEFDNRKVKLSCQNSLLSIIWHIGKNILYNDIYSQANTSYSRVKGGLKKRKRKRNHNYSQDKTIQQ